MHFVRPMKPLKHCPRLISIPFLMARVLELRTLDILTSTITV